MRIDTWACPMVQKREGVWGEQENLIALISIGECVVSYFCAGGRDREAAPPGVGVWEIMDPLRDVILACAQQQQSRVD